MKLRDRSPSLQDPAVVKAVVIGSVYASMALENQAVFPARLEAFYARTAPALSITAMSNAREQQSVEREESWRKGFRNLIAHEYFRVDLARLWPILQDIIPGLRLVLEALFTDLDHQFGPAARV